MKVSKNASLKRDSSKEQGTPPFLNQTVFIAKKKYSVLIFDAVTLHKDIFRTSHSVIDWLGLKRSQFRSSQKSSLVNKTVCSVFSDPACTREAPRDDTIVNWDGNFPKI